MTASTKLLFIAGSARQASFNKRLARLGATIAEQAGIIATFADLADYPMPIYDGDIEAESGPPDNAQKLVNLFELHSGIFIACPEYNSTITPLLKNTLDWMSRVRDEDGLAVPVFKTRVFAIGAASPGGTGGLRGLNNARDVLVQGLGALVLPDQFLVPRAGVAFGEDGRLSETEPEGRFKEIILKLANAAEALHGEPG